jgi:hypothetical protein
MKGTCVPLPRHLKLCKLMQMGADRAHFKAKIWDFPQIHVQFFQLVTLILLNPLFGTTFKKGRNSKELRPLHF